MSVNGQVELANTYGRFRIKDKVPGSRIPGHACEANRDRLQLSAVSLIESHNHFLSSKENCSCPVVQCPDQTVIQFDVCDHARNNDVPRIVSSVRGSKPPFG